MQKKLTITVLVILLLLFAGIGVYMLVASEASREGPSAEDKSDSGLTPLPDEFSPEAHYKIVPIE